MIPPRMLISGLPGTGRHVLAERIAADVGARVIDGDMLRRLGGCDVDQDRWSTLHVVEALNNSAEPVVAIDDGALYVLEPGHDALVVELAATVAVRGQRLSGTFDARCKNEIRTADVKRATALNKAWSVDSTATTTRRWRADLVAGCPHLHRCLDLTACDALVLRLVREAIAVYQAHLADESAQHAAAFASFVKSRADHPRRLPRCSPALTDLARGVGVRRWRRRALDSLTLIEDYSHV